MKKLTTLILMAMTFVLLNGCSGSSGNPANAASPNTSPVWTPVNYGISTQFIFDFGSSGNTIFAGGVGLFRSTDNGALWFEDDQDIPYGDDITAVAVTPDDAGDTLIFAGLFPYGSTGGVYLSTDAGLKWTVEDSGLTNTEVQRLAAVRTLSAGTDLFAGTLGGGVFRSTDYGASWTAVNSGLQDLTVNSIAAIGSDVFVSTNTNFYRSTDYGGTWEPMTCDFTAPAGILPGGDLISVPTGSGETYLFGGAYTVNPDSNYLYISANDGKSWTSLDSSWVGLHVNAFATSLSAGSSPDIFAGTGDGIYLSKDYGTTWAVIDSGLTLNGVYALAVHDNYVFTSISGGGGVFRRPLGD